MFVESEGMKKETSFKITGLPNVEHISFRIELTIKKDGMLNVTVKSVGLTEEITGNLNHQMDLRPIDRDYIRTAQHFNLYLPPSLNSN